MNIHRSGPGKTDKQVLKMRTFSLTEGKPEGKGEISQRRKQQAIENEWLSSN
jgi:hypothetical protein